MRSVLRIQLIALLASLLAALTGCKPAQPTTTQDHATMAAENTRSRLRDLIPPLFNPHRTSFTCVHRDAVLPPVDPQADAWLQEAILTEFNDGSSRDDVDWSRVIELTRKAAERHHWKAMLNLINLRIDGAGTENRGLPQGPDIDEQVVLDVEAAMALDIPDAWNMMGRLYAEGIGVQRDMSKAYAFYQRAADMGSPAAQAALGEQLDATYDDPQGQFWGNEAIGVQMLECAVAQGYGPAAYSLGISYALEGDENPTMKAKALRIFHEGVKMGSAECAFSLSSSFEGSKGLTSVAPMGIDTARAERYQSLGRSLEWYTGYGTFPFPLPNLDKVLPLPPAKLPYWDGDRDTLLDAAKPVRQGPRPPPPTKASQREGRHYLPAEFAFGQPADEGVSGSAPHDGFWLPRPGSDFIHPTALAVLDQVPPGRYEPDEPFPLLLDPGQLENNAHAGIRGVRWHPVPIIRVWPPTPRVRVERGLERQAPYLADAPKCRGDQPCPRSGTWQASVSPNHPLARLINKNPLRQAWVNADAHFPDPQTNWLFNVRELGAKQMAWQLIETDINQRNADSAG